MTRALTYVEIDIPAFVLDSPDLITTYRFAVDTDYLPNTIPAIPSITEISIEPATISLGENLGQRASVTVTFRDHRHIFNGEDFDSGTFWGKFRARYGLKLHNTSFRLIRGTLGQELEEMETRLFLIESQDGPADDGSYKIIAKDTLRLVTGDQAQAPDLSNGFLAADVAAGALSLTLLPAGINTEYPANGYMAIGGSEIVEFVNNFNDTFTIIRAQFNTPDSDHRTNDRAQLCLRFDADDPAEIIQYLLVNHSLVDPDFINLDDWTAETDAYLGVVYSAVIAEPTPVDQLLSELIEQAALAIWWDDIRQTLRLQVLRPVSTTASIYDETLTLAGTLEITERPERRLSEVQVYFGKINPLVKNDEENNFACTHRLADDTAVDEYGGTIIKKIMSRWIKTDGRAIAEVLCNKQLGRFRDPPRLIRFALPRDQAVDPQLGAGYQLGGTPFQTTTGEPDLIPIQVTRLNPYADRFELEAEEMLWTPFGADINPTNKKITFDFQAFDVNLRTVHDSLYGTPQTGDTITAIIQTGVVIGTSRGAAQPPENAASFVVGNWPAGVTINIVNNGRIQGAGGEGGAGGSGNIATNVFTDGQRGTQGGGALSTGYAINLTNNGSIWAGGGGGGGYGANQIAGDTVLGGQSGAGGAGFVGGDRGAPGVGIGTNETNIGAIGAFGTPDVGGLPNGGQPGQAGGAGIAFTTGAGAGGPTGIAINGNAFVTYLVVGDILGTIV